MKALSVKQPWAWLIVYGYKPIENRDWPSFYRGPLLIHASASGGMADYKACQLFLDSFCTLDLPPFGELHRGGIVGAVRMEGCISTSAGLSREHANWFTGRYGFLFSRPCVSDYLAIPGKLGFWDVPPLAVPKGLEHLSA